MTKRLGASGALILIVTTAGCAYYNAMWSAERYAKDARHLEQRGQTSEARSQWALAASKAEDVVTRHPRSRWADDALTLQAEGLARSGACEAAADPIVRVRATAKDVALRERAELADAECALAAGHPIQAAAALVLPLRSKNDAHRSRAEYLAGQAAALRLDYDAAAAHFARSGETAARPEHVRVLLSAGRSTEAAAGLDALIDPAFEIERAELLGQLAVVGGPDAASKALDRMLERGAGRLTFTEQARLLAADADRRFAHGEWDAAAARYRRAALVAPAATNEAGTALVGMQRVAVGRATRRSDLAPIAAELTRLLRTETGTSSAKPLLELVTRAITLPETPGERFRVAELVRDSLGAQALAGQLFLDGEAADTASLYAPKALLSALALLPERRDSIAALLDSRYATSPYTRAFHGEPSVAYAAAEDSLARELGVQIADATVLPAEGWGGARGGGRVDLPVPGPRGPRLEPEEARARPRPAQPRPSARPRDRPAQPDRP